jgi:uncharacterized protein (TIGR03437 family)
MKAVGRVAAILLIGFVALLLTSPAIAETLTATVQMSSVNEIAPPVPIPAGVAGSTVLTFNITRDNGGNITSASVNFLTQLNFPGSVTVVGLHIHEAVAGVNGAIKINTGLSATNNLTFASGQGLINLTANNADIEIIKKLLANPAGYYVNLHSTVNPAGAMRGQISANLIKETLGETVQLSPANEVNPNPAPPANITGQAAININPTRNALGVVTGGSVTFTVSFDFKGPVTVVGLHIHEGAATVNGPIRIDTGLSATNNLVVPGGVGTVNLTAQNVDPQVLQRVLANPAGWYVNIHSTFNPGGAMRSQLSNLVAPAVITSLSSYAVVMQNSPLNIALTGESLDNSPRVLVNGQTVDAIFNAANNTVEAQIPANLVNTPGKLFVQLGRSTGPLSTALVLIVVDPGKATNTNASTVDSARFGPLVSPEGIASVFGSSFAPSNAGATAIPLPTTLNGTQVFVSGVAARLFFVGPQQANFQVPTFTAPGTATIVVAPADGAISQGTVPVAVVAPGFFTTTTDGKGAPAAVASYDGSTFNVPVSNPDGTPAPINAGAFVALFGSGFRFAQNTDTATNGVAESVDITVGGVKLTPLFVGPQGFFVGLDQLNIQIPASLAKAGPVELVATIKITDGMTGDVVSIVSSNTVQLNIN